ncbi:Alkylated dna repair protein alkb 8 [Globisporangium polare]
MDSVGSTTVAAPSGDGRDHKSTRAVAPPEPDESASEGESDDGGKAAERKVNANDSDDDDGEEGEDDDGDGGYDSDTQIVRIADSAASFARRCIASGELSKALLALQNAVQVAEPTSAAYAQCVLLLAQLFQLSGHVDASLQCVLGVYKCMPAPYTLEDGLVVIARLYERESAHALAALWWNKLIARQQQATSLAQQRQQERQAALRRASALADFATRSFAQRDFVFARDAHRELFDRHQHYYEKGGQLSYAFMRKCLHSTLQVRDLAANHKLERTQLAWGLARMASGLWPHDYADPEFYNLRSVYSASFPAIYKVVFAWDDAPARVLAQYEVAASSPGKDKSSRDRSIEKSSVKVVLRGFDFANVS